jgi:hypothetical protein
MWLWPLRSSVRPSKCFQPTDKRGSWSGSKYACQANRGGQGFLSLVAGKLGLDSVVCARKNDKRFPQRALTTHFRGMQRPFSMKLFPFGPRKEPILPYCEGSVSEGYCRGVFRQYRR